MKLLSRIRCKRLILRQTVLSTLRVTCHWILIYSIFMLWKNFLLEIFPTLLCKPWIWIVWSWGWSWNWVANMLRLLSDWWFCNLWCFWLSQGCHWCSHRGIAWFCSVLYIRPLFAFDALIDVLGWKSLEYVFQNIVLLRVWLFLLYFWLLAIPLSSWQAFVSSISTSRCLRNLVNKRLFIFFWALLVHFSIRSPSSCWCIRHTVIWIHALSDLIYRRRTLNKLIISEINCFLKDGLLIREHLSIHSCSIILEVGDVWRQISACSLIWCACKNIVQKRVVVKMSIQINHLGSLACTVDFRMSKFIPAGFSSFILLMIVFILCLCM